MKKLIAIWKDNQRWADFRTGAISAIIFMVIINILLGLLFAGWAGAWEPMPCDTEVKITQTVAVSKTVPKLLYFVGTWLWVEGDITWYQQNHSVDFTYIDNELALQMREGIKAKAATERLIKKMCKED